MKKKFLKILNRYSLIYLPVGWIVGLAVFFIAFEPISALYFLSFVVIGISYALIFYTSNRKMVDDSYDVSDYEYSIIEFYSDAACVREALNFAIQLLMRDSPVDTAAIAPIYRTLIDLTSQKEERRFIYDQVVSIVNSYSNTNSNAPENEYPSEERNYIGVAAWNDAVIEWRQTKGKDLRGLCNIAINLFVDEEMKKKATAMLASIKKEADRQ